jgi:hypothetical protein
VPLGPNAPILMNTIAADAFLTRRPSLSVTMLTSLVTRHRKAVLDDESGRRRTLQVAVFVKAIGRPN